MGTRRTARAKRNAAAHDVIRLGRFLPYCFNMLGYRLSLTNADLEVRQHRLSLQEWKVLSIVADRGPLTPHKIRALGTQDKSTISWAIKRLKQGGLVATGPARDHRTFDVAMTDEGWRYYEALVPEARRRAARGLRALSAAELRALRSLVEKLLPPR